MSQVSIDEAVQIAVDHHRAGRLPEAEAIYRQILAAQPAHSQALHLLGALAFQVSQPGVAVELIRRSLAINPQCTAAQSNLGDTLCATGEYDAAAIACRAAIRLERGLPEAQEGAPQCNLGDLWQAAGRIDEAIDSYRRRLERDPHSAVAHNNLGNALTAAGRFEEAIAEYRTALERLPQSASTHNNLGNALTKTGEFEAAAAACRRALELEPRFAEAYTDPYFNLAGILADQGKQEEALATGREAIRLDPARGLEGFGETKAGRGVAAYYNLATMHLNEGDFDEAIAGFQEVVRLDPGHVDAFRNLGFCYKALGLLDSSVECYRKAQTLIPHDGSPQSDVAFNVCFHPGSSASDILAEAREWDRRHGQPLKAGHRPHENEPLPERRLRVGYVSADFREHVVGRNIFPLLREHDRQAVEVFCYCSTAEPDAFTEVLRKHADHWRDITAMPDDEAAELIRNDAIDILVDLAVHTAHNRLLVFARKPAPIQVTYLGYCGTTGLDTMDYRFSDPYFDPVGADLGGYSEETVRLPRNFWCYEPVGAVPEVSPQPAVSKGYVTFGCLNNFAKISPPAQKLWAQILAGLPNSRLLMYAPKGACREPVRERFAEAGVSPDRVEFVSTQPWEGYIASLQGLDLALDPFPYGGGISTCDALWMGVPVISLAGKTSVGRGGRSILNNIGLPELAVETEEEYRDVALALARDLPRLERLRFSLRERVERSPLRDARGFARDVEAAYREMWRKWSEGQRR